MVFSSPIFLFLFLPVVFGLQFVVGKRLRNLFLLIASLIFYTWGAKELASVLVASIILNYVFAAFISREPRKTQARTTDVDQSLPAGHSEVAQQNRRGLRPKLLLGAGIAFNLGILISLKYSNFIITTANEGFSLIGLDSLHFTSFPIYPTLGVSFFTFSAMSYLVDLYRGEVSFDRNPINTALYISFFPKLLAGPIVRYRDVADQMTERQVTLDKFASGMQRVVVGLGKKVLIADTLGGVANQIFGIPASQLTPELSWLGIACFTLQIYFDFSGYSDMAIGLGRMAGFDFLENFNYPYVSQSVREFWRRWHISLSTWFRDYLYIPLGGNRRGAVRLYANLMIVFFLCGLWHGAGWTFVVWGIWHGTFMVLEHSRFGKVVGKVWSPVQWAYALLVAMIGWVFFRASTIGYATSFVMSMFGYAHGNGLQYPVDMYVDRLTIVALVAAVIGCFPVFPALARYRETVIGWSKTRSQTVQSAVVAGYTLAGLCFFGGILILSAMVVAGTTYKAFLYFQF